MEFEPHAKVTALIGENGAGKTNILEAIYLASALRPLRALSRSSELITFGEEAGAIKAQFDLDGPLPVEVILEKRGRRATFADKRVRDIAEVAARVGVVAFVPSDLDIVRGAPERRRRALDRLAFQLRPSFIDVARRYERALSSRNRLLKSEGIDRDIFAAYSAQLVDAGAELIVARKAVLADFAPEFERATSEITGATMPCTLSYRTPLLGESAVEIARNFTERLREQSGAEQNRHTTLSGPHLDDIRIEARAHRARHTASQGEARAIVLAWKLAEVRLLHLRRGTAPLFLLDDVAGELDPRRASFLFDTVRAIESQTFVSATHLGVLPSLDDALVLEVAGGEVQ